MEDRLTKKNLSLKERITLPGVAFSPNYFEFAMQAIDDKMSKHPEKTYYHDLKAIVFRRLIFEYFILFCPFYLMIILFVFFSCILLQILSIILFKKFHWPLELNKKILYIVVSFEKRRIIKEYEAGFISSKECKTQIQKVESQHSTFVEKISY